MMIHKSVFFGTLLYSLVSTVVAGPLEIVEKVVTTASDAAVGITNSVTGGVTSKTGKVTAEGRVGGDVTNAAIGDKSIARTSVGSNRGVTAQGDIQAVGVVEGKLTNVASGTGAEAITTIGSNGN